MKKAVRTGIIWATVTLGCQGSIDADTDNRPTTVVPKAPGQPSDPKVGPTMPPADPMTAPVGSGRAVAVPDVHPQHGAIGIRRLTRFEYGNTVADLLGIKGAESDIEDDDTVGYLRNNQNAMRVGQADLEAYERAANKISNAAMATLKLPDGCTADAFSADCANRFLPDFLFRAFRRPATKAEVDRYAALFTKLAADGPKSEALRGVLQGVLLAPSFLYRTELGQDGKNLNPFELANRLSYFLWASMPDPELFQKAKDGALKTRPQWESQVRRLMGDPRAARSVQNILFEWFGMTSAQLAKKGKDVLGSLNAGTLQTALEEETRRFIAEALLGMGGSFDTLYAAKWSFVNDTVAGIYGIKGVTGKDFAKKDLDANSRRGLFTQPLVLAGHTKESGYSVVQMGRFVRERLLCQEVPPPPPNTITELDDSPAKADLPYRQKFEMHATDPTCKACHSFLDPPGFAYLSYDPIGRFKPNDPKGIPFDTKGDLTNLDGKSVSFTSAPSMLDAIATSQDARGCFARKFTEYAFGRQLAKADGALYERLVKRLEDKGDFATVLVDLVSAPEFTVRGPDEVK